MISKFIFVLKIYEKLRCTGEMYQLSQVQSRIVNCLTTIVYKIEGLQK